MCQKWYKIKHWYLMNWQLKKKNWKNPTLNSHVRYQYLKMSHKIVIATVRRKQYSLFYLIVVVHMCTAVTIMDWLKYFVYNIINHFDIFEKKCANKLKSILFLSYFAVVIIYSFFFLQMVLPYGYIAFCCMYWKRLISVLQC